MAMSSQVRTVVELFCTIVQQNNLSYIRAETLRQAKYNKDAAAASMWKLLFDIIMFCKTHKGPKQIPVLNGEEDKVVYVKSELQKWGYLSCSFADLPSDMSTGSRELLLALGWLVYKQKVFDKIMPIRSNPLHQHLRHLTKLDSISSAPMNRDTCSDLTNFTPRDIIQQQLVLCNKLHLACRRLYSVSQEHRCLTNKIHQFTQGVSLQPELNHLTPLEVYLLRHPESLKQMVNEFEKDNIELQNLLDWKDQEHVFWDWMHSVLNLHLEENSVKEKKRSTPHTEEVYLPVPSSLGKDIAGLRSELRDFILRHESEIERLDQLLHDKKMSSSEVQVITGRVDAEIAQLAGRLKRCSGSWWDTSVVEPSSENSLAEDSAEVSDVTLGDGKKARSKFIPHSEKGIKSALKESTQQEVKKEIKILEQEIQKLKTELKQIQLENVQKLQSYLDTDPNIICIQPRCFKQLLGN